jgi:hypothetical protein
LLRAQKSLQAIASLGNKAQYEWTDNERERIVQLLVDEIAVIDRRMKGERQAAPVTFDFDS